jgi:hypothetical protein
LRYAHPAVRALRGCQKNGWIFFGHSFIAFFNPLKDMQLSVAARLQKPGNIKPLKIIVLGNPSHGNILI